MANCHDLFQEFLKSIELTSSKKDYLRKAKDAVRVRIRDYFKETLEANVPKFFIQGSYAMGTLVNPLNGEYDIDDGVYLQNLDSDISKWATPETVHNWIYKAVDGHTKEKPIDKKKCVRVVYSGDYHLDLPMYGIYNDEYYLAEKGDAGWHISDPQAFINWFRGEVKNKGEQLRRIVKFMKAWADHRSSLGKLPPGFILTVLIAEGLQSAERDDSSFAGTARKIYDRILVSTEILNPVDPAEDLGKRLTEPQINNFKDRLSTLLENASDALKEDDKEKACKKWKREFGDRFPKCEGLKKKIDTALKTSAPAILKDDARSA